MKGCLLSAAILLIEDDPQVRMLLPRFLQREGFTVDTAADGRMGIEMLSRVRYNLLLLDINLPDTNGWAILHDIRTELLPNLPVILLTAISDTSDRVHGLQLGADDYIVKPYEPSEVAARVKAVLRRSAPHTINQPAITFTGLQIDPSTWQVTRAGKLVELTTREFKLLHGLAIRSGRVFTRSMLAEEVWGDDEYPDDHTIDVTVARLRKKLDANDGIQYITTIRGVGYRFEVQHETT